MDSAIIISLRYLGSKSLQGAYNDMINACKWAQSRFVNIITITDMHIETDEYLSIFPSFSPSEDKFIDVIKEHTTDKDKVFIYISGHCYDNSFILPDGKVHLQSVKDTLLECTNKTAEIFWLMDTCNPFHEEVSYISSKTGIEIDTDGYYFSQSFIFICSSTNDMKSYTGKDGSIFSLAFFKDGNSKQLCSAQLAEDLKSLAPSSLHRQSCAVYKTFDRDKSYDWM